MTTATITRIYQVTLPDSEDDQETLRGFLMHARANPDDVFQYLVQDDVDGILNFEGDE